MDGTQVELTHYGWQSCWPAKRSPTPTVWWCAIHSLMSWCWSCSCTRRRQSATITQEYRLHAQQTDHQDIQQVGPDYLSAGDCHLQLGTVTHLDGKAERKVPDAFGDQCCSSAAAAVALHGRAARLQVLAWRAAGMTAGPRCGSTVVFGGSCVVLLCCNDRWGRCRPLPREAAHSYQLLRAAMQARHSKRTGLVITMAQQLSVQHLWAESDLVKIGCCACLAAALHRGLHICRACPLSHQDVPHGYEPC